MRRGALVVVAAAMFVAWGLLPLHRGAWVEEGRWWSFSSGVAPPQHGLRDWVLSLAVALVGVAATFAAVQRRRGPVRLVAAASLVGVALLAALSSAPEPQAALSWVVVGPNRQEPPWLLLAPLTALFGASLGAVGWRVLGFEPSGERAIAGLLGGALLLLAVGEAHWLDGRGALPWAAFTRGVAGAVALMLALERTPGHRRWLSGALLALLPIAPVLTLWSDWSFRVLWPRWGGSSLYEAHRLLALALAAALAMVVLSPVSEAPASGAPGSEGPVFAGGGLAR